ncbi:MAG: leucine-rich repeat protein [Oscillospiraceae bacterium]|nr:leucine-rich repeat protein [Oscillospiraceae bacterium]
MKKTIISLTAFLLAAVNMAGISSSAYVPPDRKFSEDTRFVTYDGLEYAIEGDCAKIIGATDTSVVSVTIPAEIEGLPVDVDYFYFNCFQDCPNLTEILVDPENINLESIDGVLFEKGVRSLCIYPCGREGDVYVVPDGIRSIDPNAFSNCTNLREITIAQGVHIESRAFNGCSSIEKFTNPILLRDGFEITGCYGLKELNLAEPEKKDSRFLELHIEKFKNLETLTIPKNYNLGNTVLISDCPNLKSIELPGGFCENRILLRRCENLESFSMPITTIENTFYITDCDKLTSLDLSNIAVEGRGASETLGCIIEDCDALEHVQLPDAAYYRIEDCPKISKLSFESERTLSIKLKKENSNLKDLYIYDTDCGIYNISVTDSEYAVSVRSLVDMGVTIHCRKANKQMWTKCEEYNIPYVIIEDEIIPGDVSNDGKLDILDVVMLNRVVVGVESATTSKRLAGDLNGNSKLELEDSMAILRKLVGLDA